MVSVTAHKEDEKSGTTTETAHAVSSTAHAEAVAAHTETESARMAHGTIGQPFEHAATAHKK